MSLLRLFAALVISASLSTAAHAQTVITIGSGFDGPNGIALDSAGNVIVADGNNGAVKRIIAAGGYTTVQTLGSGFGAPIGLAVDSTDNVYFSEFSSASVRRMLAAGGYTTVQTLFTTGTVVAAIDVDAALNVFTANSGDNAVRRYTAAGGYTSAPLLGSGFAQPLGIALDASSNVYVADFSNNQVKRVLAAGNYTTVQTLGSGFQFPTGVAVHSNGDVYVTEYTGAVKRIDAAGGFTTVTTLATGLLRPVDIAVDAAGDLYVADSVGDRVVKILTSIVSTTTSVSSNINPSVFRQNVTFTATVTGNAPTGTVNVFTGTDLVCGGTLPVGGNTVSCSSTALLAIAHSITAVYSGNASNGPSTSAPLTQIVNKAATTTNVAAPGPITLGQSSIVTATVAVTAPGGGTPTGVISISDGVVNCSIVLPLTSCSLTPTSTGLRTVTASYAGDANYIASSSTTPLTVLAPASSTTLTSSINPSVFGQSVTFTATITGNVPTGTVDFFDGATPLCIGIPLATALATCTSTALTTGAHSITAVYGGDANNAASTSAPLTQGVGRATTAASVNAPSPITLGQSVLVTATVAVSAPGAGTPTGTISVSDGAVTCSIVMPATTCSLTPTTVGARTITASYAGDANFLASSSTASLTVNPSSTGIVVASDTNPSLRGQSITFTATVTGNTPTGTVDFLDGATPLCSSVTLAAAQATCTSATLTVGAHSVTSVYSGDANNAASTSPVIAQTVNPAATITSVSAPGPITLGQSVLVTASVVVAAPGAGTPTGTIDISDGAATCSIVLPATTCSLTPPGSGARTITASYGGDADFTASIGTVTLTVNAAGQTITVVAPSTVALGDSPVTITASASSGLPVTVTSTTPNVCTVSGTGPFSVTLLSTGLCSLTATQAGDANNAPVTVIITLQVAGGVVGDVRVVPTLDRWALLGVIVLLGMIGTLRARRS